MIRTSIASDFHFGGVNHEAVETWLRHLKETKPDRVIIAGDLLDAQRLSKFDKVPGFGDTFEDELSYTRLFLKSLREIYIGKVDIICGNHDLRFKQLLWRNAEELSGMSGFTIPELLHFEEFGITYHDIPDGAAKFIDNYIEDQGFLIGHFNLARKGAGNTARGLLDTYGANIVQSHCHRMALIYKRQYDRTLIGVECGCMCSLTPPWMKQTDWANGWVDLVDGIPELHYITP